MKTDLATIDRVVGERIDAMRKDPPVFRKDAEAARTPVEVAGFKVVDERVVSERLQAAQQRTIAALESYANDSARVTSRLKALGVTPLAVAPTVAWRKICFDSGLIFIAQSHVVLNTHGIATRLMQRVLEANRRTPASTLQRIAGRVPEPVERTTIEREIDKHIASLTPIEMLRALTYDGRTMRGLDDLAHHYNGTFAELVLPDPPADVVDVLCKVKSLNPMTTAEPGAVSFRGTSIAQLIRSACAEVEQRAAAASMMIAGAMGFRSPANDEEARAMGYRDREDWRRRCPIVHVDDGMATAVVAQFGDFPIEKEVVERAIAGEIFEPLEEPNPAESVLRTNDGAIFRIRNYDAGNVVYPA